MSPSFYISGEKRKRSNSWGQIRKKLWKTLATHSSGHTYRVPLLIRREDTWVLHWVQTVQLHFCKKRSKTGKHKLVAAQHAFFFSPSFPSELTAFLLAHFPRYLSHVNLFQGAAGNGLIQCNRVVIRYSAAGLQVSKNDLWRIWRSRCLPAFVRNVKVKG